MGELDPRLLEDARPFLCLMEVTTQGPSVDTPYCTRLESKCAIFFLLLFFRLLCVVLSWLPGWSFVLLVVELAFVSKPFGFFFWRKKKMGGGEENYLMQSGCQSKCTKLSRTRCGKVMKTRVDSCGFRSLNAT